MSGEPNFSINFTAPSVATANAGAGDCLLYDTANGVWKVATSANRTAANVGTQAIALGPTSSQALPGVPYQSSGIVSASVSGLASLTPGPTNQLVRTSSTGRLERVSSYTTGDDIVGYAFWDGRVALHLGLPWETIATSAGLAVTFDTTGARSNIVANRASEISPINNAKKGIVNLGSADGIAPGSGVSGDYATFVGGNTCTITGTGAGGGGYRPNALSDYAWCFGYSIFADGYACFAAGDRNVAGQTAAVSPTGTRRDYATAFGTQTQARAHYSFAAGSNCIIDETATGATAFGLNCLVGANAVRAVAMGNQCSGYGIDSVAMGKASRAGVSGAATGEASVAIGYTCVASGDVCVAIGHSCVADHNGAVALGKQNQALALYAVALGSSSIANGDKSVAFGSDCQTGGAAEGSVARGVGARTVRPYSRVWSAFPLSDAAGQDERIVLKATTTGSTTENAVDPSRTNELTLSDNKNYSIELTVLASRTDAAGGGMCKRIMQVRTHAGAMTIVDAGTQTNDASLLAAGYTVVFSNPTGLKLRAACTGAVGHTVKWLIKADMLEVTGF